MYLLAYVKLTVTISETTTKDIKFLTTLRWWRMMVTKHSWLTFIVFMVFNNEDFIKEEMHAQTDDWHAVINTLTINTSAHHACIDSPHQQTQTLTAQMSRFTSLSVFSCWLCVIFCQRICLLLSGLFNPLQCFWHQNM